MNQRERLDILGQWGVGVESARERGERRVLEADLEGSPIRGQPLERRFRNFRPAVDTYVASLGGPLPYMRRLREIELSVEDHRRHLEQDWRELAAHCSGPVEFASRWRRRAQSWDFGAVNELIDRHNRFYPAEARLAMDVRTRDFALVGGQPYRRKPLDGEWVLGTFPADLDAALAS
jgi:hypothetical protein